MSSQSRKPQWRPGWALCWLLVWISLAPDSLHQVSAINLRHFIGCAVREFTFLARKPGCGSLHITTDACWGRCETWEGGQCKVDCEFRHNSLPVRHSGYGIRTEHYKPVLDPPFIESHQRVCTYNETRLVTVKLPNCLPGVDPTYTYPVALRCDCGVCLTSTTECITSV